MAVCRCHGCETARTTPYACASCGFQGEPFVFPCDCTRQWDQWVSFNASMLENGALNASDRGWIEAKQQQLMAVPHPTRCDALDSLFAHGAAGCPACGDCGSDDPFEGNEEPREVASMLRELRAVLRARAAT